ncbi:hypothetical protein PIB30_042329 [Stylosanthes scabra]|uniref:Uncharacterized protein n=1 Tax=Stylosanthes scabra TaxID=79078 RepID=A0ABU6RFQ8_9FABA|nr:hypothetical protein [Stylosanthes scabra]
MQMVAFQHKVMPEETILEEFSGRSPKSVPIFVFRIHRQLLAYERVIRVLSSQLP